MPSPENALPAGADLLDVRPLLARGIDPFDVIQERWAALKPGGWLGIRAPFLPKLLMAHFSARGVQVQSQPADLDGYWLLLGPKP